MAVSTTAPDANRPILNEDGAMEQSFRAWVNTITRESLIIGSGSPEGVIPAPKGANYMDEDGATGSLMYRKRDASDSAGDISKGWIVYG